jgi:hypothetical protein
MSVAERVYIKNFSLFSNISICLVSCKKPAAELKEAELYIMEWLFVLLARCHTKLSYNNLTAALYRRTFNKHYT